MEELLGNSIGVFFLVTVAVIGFAAFMTGSALGNGWKPMWHLAVYVPLLGCVDRFLIYALFGGRLDSLLGYVVDTAVLAAISAFAHRVAKARKMTVQYPWLYERSGLLGWRRRDG
jgi:hypothetical protein